MQWKRLLSGESAKGERNYLKTQRTYEIARTLVMFAVSGSLFIAGYVQTKTRLNLLSIVAVLGMLPAARSLVSAIMFFRFRSIADAVSAQFAAHDARQETLYDCIFTSYQKNYRIDNLCVCGKTVCGYSSDAAFDEKAFLAHITPLLAADGWKDVSIKIFTNLETYLNRLDQMQELPEEKDVSDRLKQSFKNLIL